MAYVDHLEKKVAHSKLKPTGF